MSIKFEKPQVYAESTWKPSYRSIRIKEDYLGEVQLVIVGGSGFYNLPELEIIEEVSIETPYDRFGTRPSSHFVIGKYCGRIVAFLARHGVAHTIPPHMIPYRANFWAIKKLNPTAVILVSAVGILNADIKQGELVLVDDYIDLTRQVHTFSDKGIVAHVSMTPPICRSLCQMIGDVADELKIQHKKYGTVVCISGPQYSTPAESHMIRNMGLNGPDLVGMTTAPELKYARESEICAGVISVPTDYDS